MPCWRPAHPEGLVAAVAGEGHQHRRQRDVQGQRSGDFDVDAEDEDDRGDQELTAGDAHEGGDDTDGGAGEDSDNDEEPEVSQALQAVFADEGIRVVRRATVTAIAADQTTGQVVASASVSGGPAEFRADRVLVAMGRRPVTDGLNLPAVEVKTGPDCEVVVSDQLASSHPRIWAAGDVTGHREFVYVAASHGAMVVDNAFTGAERSVDYAHLPRVTFTSPAVGAVGMTEEQVLAAGLRCDCRVLPLRYVPRALVNRDTRGFIKVVADADTGRSLGVTAVAKDAGELAAAGVYLLEGQLTDQDQRQIGQSLWTWFVDQVAHAWAPYLTMAEGIKIACQSFTTDVSKLSCCAS